MEYVYDEVNEILKQYYESKSDPEKRKMCMVWLRDRTQWPHPPDWGHDCIVYAVDNMIELFLTEPNIDVQAETVSTIQHALGKPIAQRVNFQPVINSLNTIDGRTLNLALKILESAKKKECIPIFRSYLNHSDEFISQSARQGLEVTEKYSH